MKRKGYFFIKRTFDIFASLLGIVITSPIWLITIIGIEISDPGPIFYRARRIGKDNAQFIMWKFRSMRVPKKKARKVRQASRQIPIEFLSSAQSVVGLKSTSCLSF